ncbi:GPI-anchor transamidase component PIGU-like isoform X1 [Branchiostoma floridae x Branchiostoma japonicum]
MSAEARTDQRRVRPVPKAIKYLFGLGLGARAVLMSSHLSGWLQDRLELASPVTSWTRMTEGLSLLDHGISPYEGDMFHETPLVLMLFYCLNKIWSGLIPIFFLLVDCITACLLHEVGSNVCRHLLEKQGRHVKTYSTDSMSLLLTGKQLNSVPRLMMGTYLCNPLTIASCAAFSTTGVHNLAIAAALLGAVKGKRLVATLATAVASYQCVYPEIFIIPVAMYIAQLEQGSRFSFRDTDSRLSMLQTAGGHFAWLGFLWGLSYLPFGSMEWLYSTRGFVMLAPDLTPNMGLFWYFFTEMFEHFRIFFLCVFQLNAVFYVIPLAIKLRDHPMFHLHLLVGLTAVFKSYPTFGDAALFLSLLPVWGHCFKYMRNLFLVVCMWLYSIVLAPVLWHLWIYYGSANANFFYAVTLAYATAQIFLLTDLLYAFLRREFHLRHGPAPKEGQGMPILMNLK